MSSSPLRNDFCSEVSREAGEPLGATASRVDHWILFEYRGVWSHDSLAGSGLSDQVKAHLAQHAGSRPHSKLLFIRRGGDRRERRSLAVFLARTKEGSAAIRRVQLEDYEDVLEHDLSAEPGEPIAHPLLLVCTHGKHDRCCARYGRPLYEALREQAEPDWVWQSTHVGGDRFAGNLVCLPEGAYFGRVGRDDVLPLAESYFEGRIRLENYRGRSCHTFVVQAAERAVRADTGLVRFDEVRFESVQRTADDRWLVRLRARGERHRVEVVREEGPLGHLTCSTEILRRPRRYTASGRELVRG